MRCGSRILIQAGVVAPAALSVFAVLRGAEVFLVASAGSPGCVCLWRWAPSGMG
jgi:hypothetical protein